MKSTILERKLIDTNNHEHIVLGLSGGPDSVCLFHSLFQLQEDLNIIIHPVHINHKFRPVAAEEDQSFVENLCRERDLECSTFVVDCNEMAKRQGISGEEAGRNARYEAFYNVADQVMEKYGIGPDRVKIAVAQNANDQAETLLMRIMRGTGTEGLAGIEYQREGKDGIRIIRPLLDVKREDIEKYCDENNLQPRIDHTNKQPIYTRNKIRLELIPAIEKAFNPNITDALNRLSAIAKEDKEFMDSVVRDSMKGKLEVETVKKLHPAIRKRILIKGLEAAGLDQGLTWAHVEAADRLVLEGKTGSSINLPKGFKVAIRYGEIIFLAEEMKMAEYHHGWPAKTWPEGLQLRTREPGDYILLKGVGGKKKIQDAFVDMKIQRDKRDEIPLLCRDKEVLWILGDDITGLETGLKRGRISENYQMEEETRKRIFVEFNKKI